LLGAVLLVLTLGATKADAATFCINDPPCLFGTSEPTIQDALDAAAANNNAPVEDTVRVGANGSVPYDELLSYTDATEAVHVIGVGPGKTVIDEAADSFSNAVTMLSPDSTIQNVTIMAPDISNGAALRWDGTATDIEALHTGSAATNTLGMVAQGAAELEDSRVDVNGFRAYETQGATGAQIRDTSIESGGSAIDVSNGESLTVRRSTIRAPRGALSAGGGSTSATLENIVVQQTDPLPVDGAIEVLSGASVVVNHATLDGVNTGRGASVDATSADSMLTISNSIISDFGTALLCAGSGNTATLGVEFSNWTAPTETSDPDCADTFGGGNTSVTPQYAGTGFIPNFRLKAPSPLIDAGEPGDPLNEDRDGLTRPIDGDGAGGARTDMGAYEYQRQPPSAVLNGPSSATVGQAVAFGSGGTSDPDPGDTLGLAWTFGDGGTASGSGVQHTYSTPGTRTVTLTVTDPTGLTDTATKQIDVTGGGGGGGNGQPVSNEFSFGKAKKNKKKGTAILPVTVPGAGTLSLSGKGVVKQRPLGAAHHVLAKTVSAAGTVKLKIKAKGKAKRQLDRTGTVKVKAKVTYTPTGGDPNTQSKRIKLIKRL
jgi:hypothetical protein